MKCLESTDKVKICLLSMCVILLITFWSLTWCELPVESCGIDDNGVRIKTSAFIVMPDDIALAGVCQIQNISTYDLVIFDSVEGFLTVKAGECVEGSRVCGFVVKANENGWEQLEGEILVVANGSGKQLTYKVEKLGTRYWYRSTKMF